MREKTVSRLRSSRRNPSQLLQNIREQTKHDYFCTSYLSTPSSRSFLIPRELERVPKTPDCAPTYQMTSSHFVQVCRLTKGGEGVGAQSWRHTQAQTRSTKEKFLRLQLKF